MSQKTTTNISFFHLQTSSDPITPSDTDEEPLAKLPKLSDEPRLSKLCSDSEEYLDAKGSDVSLEQKPRTIFETSAKILLFYPKG